MRGFVTSHADLPFSPASYLVCTVNAKIALPVAALSTWLHGAVYGFDDVLRQKFCRDRNYRQPPT